jgi:hypothetical protein
MKSYSPGVLNVRLKVCLVSPTYTFIMLYHAEEIVID